MFTARKMRIGVVIIALVIVLLGLLRWQHNSTGYVIVTDTVSLKVTKEEYQEFLESSDRERVVESLLKKYREQ